MWESRRGHGCWHVTINKRASNMRVAGLLYQKSCDTDCLGGVEDQLAERLNLVIDTI